MSNVKKKNRAIRPRKQVCGGKQGKKEGMAKKKRRRRFFFSCDPRQKKSLRAIKHLLSVWEREGVNKKKRERRRKEGRVLKMLLEKKIEKEAEIVVV